MLRVVIFDFDGVICDSEGLHYKALNTVFNRYGVDVPMEVHWQKYLGYTDLENIEAVNTDYGMGLDEVAISRLLDEKKIVFDELVSDGSVVIDGVAEFIQRLVNAGIRRAVCSGALKSDIDLMLAGTEFKDAFEVIIAADDIKHGKPDPEGYLLVLEKLNQGGIEPVLPEHCIVIEDSHWGLEAAAAAGMHTIAVTNTYGHDALNGKAERVVDRLDEVSLQELKKLCGYKED